MKNYNRPTFKTICDPWLLLSIEICSGLHSMLCSALSVHLILCFFSITVHFHYIFSYGWILDSSTHYYGQTNCGQVAMLQSICLVFCWLYEARFTEMFFGTTCTVRLWNKCVIPDFCLYFYFFHFLLHIYRDISLMTFLAIYRISKYIEYRDIIVIESFISW